MKYALILIFLVLSVVAHSQDTLQSGRSSGRGDQGHGDTYGTMKVKMMDTLDNRKLLFKGLVKDTCVETGRIVLTVMVNRKGKVINASVSRGTTSASTCLTEAAKVAALQSKFERNEKAAVLQPGRMVFYFSRQ